MKMITGNPQFMTKIEYTISAKCHDGYKVGHVTRPNFTSLQPLLERSLLIKCCSCKTNNMFIKTHCSLFLPETGSKMWSHDICCKWP